MDENAIQIPEGRPRLVGFTVTPHILFDDGEILREGPPVGSIDVPPDGLETFLTDWPGIFEEVKSMIKKAQTSLEDPLDVGVGE